jgi:fumarate reductase flavoprotein subunit
MDDCVSGTEVFGNVFYKVHWAMFIGGGRDHRVENNLFVDCDPAVLGDTLRSIAPGQIDAFGRRFARALSGTLHAVKVTGALFHTQGGLDVDACGRVLRDNGTPLPNLLAAGGAARGVSGNAAWGYLSGNGLLSAVAGGLIAAQTLARRVTEGT